MKYRIRKNKIGNPLLAGLIGMAVCFFGCTMPAEKYESTGVGMGTIISQTVYVQGNGKEVLQRINSLVEKTENEISWRLEGSDVSGINASAGSEAGYAIPKELAADLRCAWQVSADSAGALDLTIAPVARLWDIDKWAAAKSGETNAEINAETNTETNAALTPKLPTSDEIKDKLSRTGYANVTIDDNMIYLPEGYMLDLGAVGKGMACDRILALLEDEMAPLSATQPISERATVQGAVISLGGNILTYGTKPDGTAWKVGIVDPFHPDRHLGMLTLSGTNFVTTSGDYERYVEIDGVRYHHIIDPSTGYPADSGIRSVTIVSDNGLLGDALSTACFVLGQEKALELAEKYNVEILIVTKTGELVMSEGMGKVLSIKK